MTDPKRWLDQGGGGSAEERALLRAGREVTMPRALRKRVWLGIAAGAAGLGTAGAAGSALGQGSAIKGALSMLSGSAAKGVIALVIVGGAGLGVVALRSSPHALRDARGAHDAPSVRNEARSVVEAVPEPIGIQNANPPSTLGTPGVVPRQNDANDLPSRSEAAPSAVREPAPKTTAHAPGPRAAARARSGVSSPAQGADDNVDARLPEPAPEFAASRLREESAAVLAIRETLLTGNAVEALRMLERARSEFPSGALRQEREALTVRALAESHQNEAARRRGEAFLRAFPRSPYAADVRALLAP